MVTPTFLRPGSLNLMKVINAKTAPHRTPWSVRGHTLIRSEALVHERRLLSALARLAQMEPALRVARDD